MHRRLQQALAAKRTGTPSRLKTRLLYIRSSSSCSLLCTALYNTQTAILGEDKSCSYFDSLCIICDFVHPHMVADAVILPASLEAVTCACADDIEVRRHWAPGSLTTNAQTLGFPTGRGVLQTGAATCIDVWRPCRPA